MGDLTVSFGTDVVVEDMTVPTRPVIDEMSDMIDIDDERAEIQMVRANRLKESSATGWIRLSFESEESDILLLPSPFGDDLNLDQDADDWKLTLELLFHWKCSSSF